VNIINRLTLRNLQLNRRRTLVTIIGVIISVAMVTAVATIGVSFLDLLKRQQIAQYGEWHVLYENVDKSQLAAIHDEAETKQLVIARDAGYAPLAGSKNKNKPYLFIREYNARGWVQFPIELTRGRFPRAANEVVLSEEIAANAGVKYQLGDSLVLDVGQRVITAGEGSGEILAQDMPLQRTEGQITETLTSVERKSYTVVGFMERPTWEPTWAPGYTIISYLDEGSLGLGERVDAYVVLNNVKNTLFQQAREFAAEKGIERVDFNHNLLRYYGVTGNDRLRATIYSLTAIIMAVIVLGSVALIYNAFAISVSERSRHLGMLSSVGATNRQKRNSVFFEGAVIALISIPLGVISGLVGIGITFWSINPIMQGVLGITEKLTVTVTPWSIIGTCVISILTVFISAYLPARRAAKLSAIDAIRQTADIKLDAKAVQTPRIVRKLFGMEGEIGLKNLKRNRRRYRATVFSLVISIVLFLAVSSFTTNLRKSLALSQDGVNYDISVYMGSEYTKIDALLPQAIISLADVTEYSVINRITLTSWVEETDLAPELRQQVRQDRNMLTEGKYPYYIDIYALDEESFKFYARGIDADYQQLQNPDNLAGIVIDTTTYQDPVTRKFVETKAIEAKIGQKLALVNTDPETGTEKYLFALEVAALTDQLPMGVMPARIGGVNVVISAGALERLLEEHEFSNLESRLFLKSTDPMATQHQIEDMLGYDMYVYNVYQARQREEQMILLMSVFTYGFIVLITAISIANIFNTISTSIALRKREFAMLKSVGMTPRGFSRMLNYESIFYGIISLFYGLPLSIVVMYLIHRALRYTFSFAFTLPWASILYVIGAVFIIVTAAMFYAGARVKRENIIDTLKQENI
jgi:putative ABC transport system permease protein